MEFSRIDDATVRCILTEEDLKERDIELEDFFKNKEKVQNFFEEIVEEAKKEVSYESNTGVLAVQVMPLPENGLAIVFSENAESDFDGLVKNIKDMMGELKESAAAPKKILKEKKSSMEIYRFATLSAVEMFSLSIPQDKKIKSQLLKNEAESAFYLVLEKGRISAKLFNGVCERAIEFSDFVSDSPVRLLYHQEHDTCIIEKNALFQMQKIAKGGNC
ncbi:MAG: adaptor protein MecA [Acetivibrio sp.]